MPVSETTSKATTATVTICLGAPERPPDWLLAASSEPVLTSLIAPLSSTMDFIDLRNRNGYEGAPAAPPGSQCWSRPGDESIGLAREPDGLPGAVGDGVDGRHAVRSGAG